MNKEDIINWFNERSPREKAVIAILGFILIYFFIYFLFIHPVNKSIQNTVETQAQQQKQIEEIRNQRKAILQILSDPTFQQAFQEQKRLQLQTKNIGKKIYQVSPNVLKPEDFPRIMKEILALPANVSIVDIKRMETEPWIPKGLEELNLPVYFATIYKYNVELEFKGTYFNAIDYLQKIEKLPWHIFWSSIDYKVTRFPEADVVVRIYALIEQRGEK